MKRILVLLILAAFGILGANTEYIPAAGSGVTAPGVVGNNATLATLKWIWGLERVPFPEAIDPPVGGGTWVHRYFSAEAGNLWPLGNDSNTGMSPFDPWQTIGKAKANCFTTGYIHCHFDHDDWTVGNGGWDANLGSIVDADITTTGCPTSKTGAMAQPCYWWSSPPGGRALFDGTGITSALEFMEWGPVARVHLLIEGIDITADGQNSVVPFDSDGAGILTVVGSIGTVATNITGSGQVLSSHDVAITSLYGNSDLIYTGTASGGNSMIGTQFGSTVAVHTSNTLEVAPVTTTVANALALVQSGGAIDASLAAESLATPAYALITGAHLLGTDTSSTSAIINFGADAQASSSNQVEGLLISTYLEQPSTSVVPEFVSVTNLDGGSTNSLTMLYTTFGNSGSDGRSLHIQDGTLIGSDTIHVTMNGSIVMGDGDTSNFQIVRIADDNWLDDSAGTFTMNDTIYESLANGWRISNATLDCLDATPADLQSCANAIRAGAVDIDNNATDAAPDETGGAATSGGASTLVDTGISWATNEWAGGVVTLISGTGLGQRRRVVSNTTDTLTVSPIWTINPSTNPYEITLYIDGNGYCNTLDNADCEADISGTADKYTKAFRENGYIPAFMAGKLIRGFTGTPAVDNNEGRQLGTPWSGR